MRWWWWGGDDDRGLADRTLRIRFPAAREEQLDRRTGREQLEQKMRAELLDEAAGGGGCCGGGRRREAGGGCGPVKR